MKCFGNFCGLGNWSLLGLRLTLGAIFIVHGLKKWSVWDSDRAGAMNVIMKILSIVEPLGGATIILGGLTQITALGFIIIMLGALYSKIFSFGAPFAGGWAYELLILISAVVLLAFGPGKYALDPLLGGNKNCFTDRCRLYGSKKTENN